MVPLVGIELTTYRLQDGTAHTFFSFKINRLKSLIPHNQEKTTKKTTNIC
jgi:hypothetical protein